MPNSLVIRFGDFSLDVRTGELDGPSGKERLQDLPLRVFTVLLENAGELVTRDQLRQRIWPGDTYVNFDNALWTAMKKLRRALNDDATAPRYLETLSKKGYRFVAEIERETREVPEQVLRDPYLSPTPVYPAESVGLPQFDRLEDENRLLKRMVVDLTLECERLKELCERIGVSA